MKLSILIMTLTTSINPLIIFDFNTESDIQNWTTVDDVVMGGKSSSTFNINPEGFGVLKVTCL